MSSSAINRVKLAVKVQALLNLVPNKVQLDVRLTRNLKSDQRLDRPAQADSFVTDYLTYNLGSSLEHD